MSKQLTPIEVIAAIRIGIKHAEFRFKNGGCFQLYLILKELFPGAEAWYEGGECHVYTKIGDDFYDINGYQSIGSNWYKLADEPMLKAEAHDWDFTEVSHETEH